MSSLLDEPWTYSINEDEMKNPTLLPEYARMFASIARDLDEHDRYVQDRQILRAYLVGLMRGLGVGVDHFVTLRGLADVLDELVDRQTVKAA